MANTLAPGSLLNGRYRIVDLAGTGGMGAVYKATDTHLGGRLVAIKEMSEQGLNPQEIAEATTAFQQEAHLLAGLQHPSLPSIHDNFISSGRWYLVMDFIEGETLEQYLQHPSTPGLPVGDVLGIANHICAVLEYLHGHVPPIIFRDLKPSNIMLTSRRQVYLIDFGIARIFKPGQTHDTIALGSLGYAAPEGHGKSQTTVRSDIYSFGVVLHQLLTGIDPAVKPFTFPWIRPSYPQVPPQLEALIMWMVQLDESRRPQDIVVIRHELDQIVRQTAAIPATVPVQPLQPAAASMPAYYVIPNAVPTAYPSAPILYRKARTNAILAVLGFLLIIICVVVMFCALLQTWP